MKSSVTPDKTLLLITFTFVGFGLVMVFSASAVATGSSQAFFRQSFFMLCGLAVMLIFMRIDYRYFGSKPILLLLIGINYLLLMGALLSPAINNTNRWLVLGPLRAQPSELSKLVVVFLTAAIFVRFQEGKLGRREAFTYLSILGSIVFLILVQPDFGTAACIICVAGFLLFLFGFRLSYFVAALVSSVPIFFFLVYRVPYRWERILSFLNPEVDPLGVGYQVRQSLIAIGSGGAGGKGFAQSKQKLAFLPEAHNDFIFSILSEELGLIGSTLLVVLFLVFFWKGIKISLRSNTVFGTFVGLGIVLMIMIQALVNISVVLGLLPTKGIPLPFISSGGSSIFMTLLSVGILLNISSNPRNSTDIPWYSKGLCR